jgi:hypothetical protein
VFNAGIDISSAGFSFDQIKGYKKKEGKELDTHTHTYRKKIYIYSSMYSCKFFDYFD